MNMQEKIIIAGVEVEVEAPDEYGFVFALARDPTDELDPYIGIGRSRQAALADLRRSLMSSIPISGSVAA